MTYRTSRRHFLFQVGGAAAAGTATSMLFDVVGKNGLPFAWGSGEGDTLASGTPVVVHIAMDGGNDHLNTLVPADNGWYYDTNAGHGTLALTAAETLALAGTTYRLHPNLPWLAGRWNTVGDVGFALGVGNGRWNFSHFDSQRFWSSANLDTLTNNGWLGRYADVARPGNALASISINDLRPEAVGRTAPTLVLQEAANFRYVPSWLDSELFKSSARQMANIGGSSKVAEVAKMIGTTFAVSDRIVGASDPAITGDGSQGYKQITKDLLQVALLVRAGMPAQSYTIGFGPFDSHSGQKQMQVDRFNELNEGLSKFFAAMAGHARERDVFVVITSEFGRQITANRDGGTDHGQAGMAMFIGGGVQRGIFGVAPTLDPGGPTRPNRVNDASRPMIDFRTVHATVLNRLAKGDTSAADSVLGAHYDDLGVFTAPSPTTTTTAVTTTTVPPTTVPPTTTTTVKPTTTTSTIANKPPVALMTLSKTSGRMPMTLTASATRSTDPDGTIKTYTWEWRDGTKNSVAKSASHTYWKKGTFQIRLTVVDNKGLSSSATGTVTVT